MDSLIVVECGKYGLLQRIALSAILNHESSNCYHVMTNISDEISGYSALLIVVFKFALCST